MSTKSRDPKGYGDFSSGIDLTAVKAFVNNYTPKNNAAIGIIAVIIIVAILLAFFH